MDVVFFLSVFAGALLLAFLISFIMLRPSKLVSRPSLSLIKIEDYKSLFQNNFKFIGSLIFLGLIVYAPAGSFYTVKIIVLGFIFLDVWGKA